MGIIKERHLTQTQKRKFTIITLILFFIFVAFLCVAIGKPLIDFANEPNKFRAWVDEMRIWGRIAFLGMVIIQVILAIIPGEPIEIAAGYAFGAFEGTVLCIIGMTIGSMIIFALVKSIGVRIVEIFFPIEKIRSLRFLQKSKSLNALTFLLFVIPGTPKDLLSYFIGLTNMKWQTWLIICVVARIPSVVTSTIGGNALEDRKYLQAVIVFSIALLLSVCGILIYNFICKIKNQKSIKEKELCQKIFNESFCQTEEFTSILFQEMFEYCEYLKYQGEIVSMLFKIPCELHINEKLVNAYYLYGVSTSAQHRGRGFAQKLLLRETNKHICFIKPINDDLITFYEKIGFKSIKATTNELENKIEVTPIQKKLSLCKCDTPDEYTLLVKGNIDISNIQFQFPLS